MKYGDTIRQRSIPAWQTHNIDYHDVKHFIKVNTTPTPGKGKAVPIPGNPDSNAVEFENKLFLILREQDERITWFVRSKVGEIQRRLAHLEQQIGRFLGRIGDTPSGRVSVKRLERYGRIESDILKVGEEIQALSRYIAVQLEAFRKLIKKHKRWTGSSELGYRFEDEVRHRHSSFSNTDLKPFLDRYEELLHTVRTLYEQTQARSANTRPRTPNRTWPDRNSSSAARFAHVRLVLDSGKRVDFDHLTATLALGHQGKNAVFWVHPENVVELKILLSQYTRSFDACCRQPSIASADPSGANSPSLAQSTVSLTDTFDIVADEPVRFLAQLASEPLGSVEDRHDITRQMAALHARGNHSDDVALLAWKQDPSVSNNVGTCAMKRKFVETTVDRKGRLPSHKAAAQHFPFEGSAASSSESVEELQQWLKAHQDIRPVTTILSERARFFNVTSSATGVVLATLDHNIHFQPGATANPEDDSTAKFPFAVLRVRQEGAQPVDIIDILSTSHLVERVPGFSLEHHAVWQATQPPSVTPPFWLTMLDQDLRKVPQAPPAVLPKKASADFASQSTTPQMSTTSSSENGLNTDDTKKSQYDSVKARTSPVFDGPNKSLTFSRKNSSMKPSTGLVNQRYYSEFDDPNASDAEDADAYVIYVNPNETTFFDRAVDSLRSLFRPKREKASDVERQPLLYSPTLGSHEDGETSDDEEEDVDEVAGNYRVSRIYGPSATAAFGEDGTAASKVWSRVPRMAGTCFLASVSILAVAFVLAATGRKKLMKEVDAGVLFAVGMSLLFAVVGVVSLWREGRSRGVEEGKLTGWVWAAAGVVLCLVGVGSGGLVAWTVA